MDEAHRETDEIISKLEKKLRRTYREAEKDAEGKFRRYMRDFIRKDEQHKKQVESGVWSQEEYENWRKNQLMYADTLDKIKKTIARDLSNVDKIAIEMVRDNQIDVYALNYNYGVYEVESGLGIDTSFTMYNRDMVKRLMMDDPLLLPKPSAKRQKEIDASDYKWNMQKLTSAFTASIIAGDSIPKMAKRISSVAQMDRNAAIRNARTMCTGAENAGRQNSYERAQALGIDIKKEWQAMLDEHTRTSHRIADGMIVPIDQPYHLDGGDLMFPGDPEGPAKEVYNCRCTQITVINGIDPGAFDKNEVLRQNLDNKDISYEEWKVMQPKRSRNKGK